VNQVRETMKRRRCLCYSGHLKTLSNFEGAQDKKLELQAKCVNKCGTESTHLVSVYPHEIYLVERDSLEFFGMGPFLVVEVAPVSLE